MSVEYTIFIDNHATGHIEDKDLPLGTTLLESTALVVSMSEKHVYANCSMRLGAWVDGSEMAKCVWANNVAHDRGITA